MAVTLNALTTGVGGLQTTADTSGQISLQSNGSTVVAVTASGAAVTGTMTVGGSSVLTSASATVGAGGITFSDGSTQTAAASPYVLKNRIINGDMRIDQRNAGASVTSGFPVDRFQVYSTQSSKWTAQQSTTAPTGFTNSVIITSSSSYSPISSDYFSYTTRIEGFNVADLDWGTANAKTITVSFWVRSSLTGTWTGALHNNAFNRVYPFSYTISSANTWEYKTVTIAGDTTGTWLTNNSVGIEIGFAFSVGSSGLGTAGAWTNTASIFGATGQTNLLGTNGATFYITGVQLEQNTSATPFERRLYGQELANCYRYFRIYNQTGTMYGVGANNSSTQIFRWGFTMDVAMRAGPTLTFNSMAGWSANGGVGGNISVLANISSINNVESDLTYSSGSATQGVVVKAHANTASSFFTVSAEL
jgi:hypothetical protein